MNVHQSNLMRGMMLIDGELVPSEAGEWLESINPANEETLGHVPQATAADVNRAVTAAEAAHPAWAAIEPKGARQVDEEARAKAARQDQRDFARRSGGHRQHHHEDARRRRYRRRHARLL